MQDSLTDRACKSPTRLNEANGNKIVTFSVRIPTGADSRGSKGGSSNNLQDHRKVPRRETNGAFPLHGTVRFGTARYGRVQLSSGRFAFPLQFSTAIEWAGLFTRRYNCAASTAVTSP